MKNCVAIGLSSGYLFSEYRVQRAIVMCDGRMITARDLLLDGRTSAPNSVSLASARSGTERNIVESALARNRYNVAATARDLAVSRVERR